MHVLNNHAAAGPKRYLQLLVIAFANSRKRLNQPHPIQLCLRPNDFVTPRILTDQSVD